MLFSQAQIGVEKLTANVSGNVSLDLDTYDMFDLTVIGNITGFTFTGGKVDRFYWVRLIQDGTGNRTIAGVDSKFKVRQGRTLLLSTNAGDIDILELEYVSSTYIIVRPDYAS